VSEQLKTQTLPKVPFRNFNSQTYCTPLVFLEIHRFSNPFCYLLLLFDRKSTHWDNKWDEQNRTYTKVNKRVVVFINNDDCAYQEPNQEGLAEVMK
jgi:hypothetical protein